MAGTVTQTLPINKDKWRVIKFACVGDADNGSYPAAATESLNNQITATNLYKFSIVPSAVTPPTNGSSFTVKDSFGVDLLGGSGATVIPNTGTYEGYPKVNSQPATQPILTPLTLAISGNSENSAGIDIYLYFKTQG